MAITADQRAMLELLLGRGQTYADLGELLGVSEAEVREKARAALTELAGADPDRNVGLTDYLLGQADPIGRADAARHLREDAADHNLASGLASSLQMLVPSANLPKLPAEPGGGRFMRRAEPSPTPAPSADPSPAPKPERDAKPLADRFSGLSSSQSRTIALLGGGGLILLVVVLAIAGVFGGGDDSSSADTASDTTTADAGGEEIEQIQLAAAKGSDATGTATFGIGEADQAYVDLDISNLEPAPEGKAYVLWLLLTESQGYPLQPFQVEQDGTFSDRIAIPAAGTQTASLTQAVDVSLAEQEPLLREVQKALQGSQGSNQSNKPLGVIPYTGETILRGAVQATGGGAGAGGSGG
jgi:hypothetical protein